MLKINTNIFKNKKIYHISHGDLDGAVSTIVGYYYISPISLKYYVLNTYEKEISDFNFNIAEFSDIIIFTDFSPTLELYDILKNNLNKQIYIFDHHQTAIEQFGVEENFIFDIERCGSKIFYDWIIKKQRKNRVLDRLVELTNIYDLWQTEHDDWLEAKKLHNSMFCHVDWKRYFKYGMTDTEKLTKFIDVQLLKIVSSNEFFFTGEEKIGILEQEEKEKQAYKDAKKTLKIRKDNENNNYAFIEITSKHSLTGNKILNELGNKIDYIVIYTTYEEDNMKISLRSHNGFDTTKISEKWNGGGHLASSAFEFKNKEDLDNFRLGKIHLI